MIGRLDTAAKRAGSLPEPLWCWCQVLIGIPNRLPGPHSKLCLRPSGASTVVAPRPARTYTNLRSEDHTSELQSHSDLVCRLLLEKKNYIIYDTLIDRA